MAIKDKLDYLQDTKQAIKTAIQGKGQSVSDTDTFRSYADKINAITTGGGGSDEATKELIEGTITEFNDTAGSITRIASYAFCIKSQLRSANFPACTNIGNSAFSSCSSLQTINFPACTNIGGYAFSSCSSLQSANFPECTSIGYYAFGNCLRLQSANFPECTSIGGNAFNRCISLQSANFPACTNIGGYAFGECSSLQTISFPKCTTISSSAFTHCKSLSALYLVKQATLGGSVFLSTPMSNSTYLGYFGSIYVRSRYLSWYQSATNWVAYSSRITTFTPTEDFLQENGGDIASGTSLTITLDGCEVGDNLIAGVITRSTSPVPSGWTLVATIATISSGSTVQNLNIYTKVATSITESITVTQATVGRMYANIVNIKNKTPSVINEFTNIYNTNTQPSITLTKPTNNEILVFAHTVFAQATGTFVVSGDYDDYYAYGDAGRLLMVQSTEEVGSQIIITNNSTGEGEWATIGIELT